MKKLVAATLLAASVSQAADSQSTKIHNQYSSLRALGMGNAFTAVADDYSLIFYNPAGFAKKKYNEVQFTTVGGGVAMKTLQLMEDIKKASDTTGTDEQKATAVANALEPYYGKALGGKVQALEMFWVRKNWGVAILPADLTIDMSINRQLGPAIDLDVKGDTTIAYGMGREYNKEISWGAAIKGVHRVAIDQSVSALELATNSNILSKERFKEGLSVDFDLGVMWTPNWFDKSRLPASVRKKKKSTTTAQTAATEKKVTETAKVEDAAKTTTVAAATTTAEASTTTTEETTAVTTSPAEVTAANGEKTPVLIEVKPKQTAETAVKTDTATGAEVKKEAVATTETPQELKAEDDEELSAIEKKAEEGQADANYPLTFGLTLKNVLGGNFSKSTMINKDAKEAPASMERTIDIGSQYEISKWGGLTIRSMLDFKNILHPKINLNKSIHAGVELDFSPSGWFKTQARVGMNQMYYTAGVTLLLGVVNIEAATYGEEVGTTSTKLENRVYAGKLGFNF